MPFVCVVTFYFWFITCITKYFPSGLGQQSSNYYYFHGQRRGSEIYILNFDLLLDKIGLFISRYPKTTKLKVHLCFIRLALKHL